jgi:two-component system chemotaxis response regulator CheY
MRILITDDDLVCTKLVSTILKPYGTCEEASNGEIAIRLFTEALVKKDPFDLVCLDIQMPGLDGHATLRCLRAIEAAFGRTGLACSKILMVTTQGDAKSVAAAFRGQCEGYVIKPIDKTQIIAQLVQLEIA